ncbi:MAG TPA: FlgD immunoglobulin-like domain containing protein [bacterium]
MPHHLQLYSFDNSWKRFQLSAGLLLSLFLIQPSEVFAQSACKGSLFVSRNIYSPTTDLPLLFLRSNLCYSGNYSIKIYNSAGELVRVLRDIPNQPAGPDQVDWDGKSTSGDYVASGVYVVLLTESYGSHVGKVLVLR